MPIYTHCDFALRLANSIPFNITATKSSVNVRSVLVLGAIHTDLDSAKWPLQRFRQQLWT